MIYSWIFGLQIEDESAKTIWNLAETSQNDILVGLAEVSSEYKMVLFFVDKNSGAELLKPYQIEHMPGPIMTIKPF